MNAQQEDFEDLIIDEILGHISATDQLKLDAALATDPGLGQLRDHLYLLAADPAYLAGKKRLTTDLLRTQASKIIHWRNIAAVAASLLIAVGFSVLLFNRQKAVQRNTLNLAASKNIHLQLASGRVIDLSHDTAANANNLQLQNHGQVLHYAGNEAAAPEWATLIVPPGKDYNIVLADGTSIQLNAATQIRFPSFFKDKREIYVDGEAYLQVAKGTAPFIVHLPGSTVQVLGTSFNVNSYEKGLDKIALVQGVVKVINKGNAAMLQPGTLASTAIDGNISQQAFDEDDLLAWRKGVYVFESATFEDMKAVIGRLYGIHIVLDDAAIGAKKYRGFMNKNKPITTFLDALAYSGTVQYHFDKDSTLHLGTPAF